MAAQPEVERVNTFPEIDAVTPAEFESPLLYEVPPGFRPSMAIDIPVLERNPRGIVKACNPAAERLDGLLPTNTPIQISVSAASSV